jgi:hypothetical protein
MSVLDFLLSQSNLKAGYTHEMRVHKKANLGSKNPQSLIPLVSGKHEQEMDIQKALEMRGGCFHSFRAPAYGSPTPSATHMDAMDDHDSDDDDFDLARDNFW